MTRLALRITAHGARALRFNHPLDIFQQVLRVQHQGPYQLPDLRLDVLGPEASHLRTGVLAFVHAGGAEVVMIEPLVPASLAATNLRHSAPADAADEHAGEFPIPVLGGGFATAVVFDRIARGIHVLARNAGVRDRHRDPLRPGPLLNVLLPVVGAVVPLGARPDGAPTVVPPDAVALLGFQVGGALARDEPFVDKPAYFRWRVRFVNVVEDHLPQRLLVLVASALRRRDPVQLKSPL